MPSGRARVSDGYLLVKIQLGKTIARKGPLKLRGSTNGDFIPALPHGGFSSSLAPPPRVGSPMIGKVKNEQEN